MGKMFRSLRTSFVAAGLLSIACGCLAACDEDIEATKAPATTDASVAADATTDTGTPAAVNALELSVTYNGAQKGPLILSVWTTPVPAGGPPAGIGGNETPTWPGTNVGTVKALNPGTYYVFAYIMVGADHRTGPTPQDPVGPPAQITVVAGQTTKATVTLFDPVVDGGTDSGTDSGTDAGTDADIADAADSG